MHGSPWLAVSLLDDIPLVILLPPHHQHHKNLCSVCVCVGMLDYVFSMCRCVWKWAYACVYVCNCVFAGARTGHNHFWWISTLALESCMFSSRWVMGLLTDACTNLLPLLLFPTPCVWVCVCESMNNYPVHRLVVVVVSSFCLWTFHSSLKQQTRRVKRERGNHSSLMTHLDREKWGNFSAGKAPQSWFPGDAAIVMWLDY